LVQFQQQHRGLGGAAEAAPHPNVGALGRAPLAYDTAVTQQPQAPAQRSISEEKVRALKAKLATLRLEYTEKHPDVVMLKRQLSQAEDERAEEVRAAPGLGGAMNPALRSAPNVLTAAPRGIGAGGAGPTASPAVQLEWAELLKNDEFLRLNYQELLSRREAARMSQAAYGADANRFQIVRRPTTPETPLGPKRKLYLIAVVLASIGAGVGASYLRAAVQGIFVSPRELEQIFDLPVVGTVSWEPAWSTAPRRRSRRRRGRPGRAVSKHMGMS
jgi:hypothetical protein